MDEKIIRLYQEGNIDGLTKAVSTLKSQKLADFLECRVLEGRGDPIAFLKAVFQGSPSSSSEGVTRRLFLYKCAIQLLNDGELSNKIATDIVGFFLMELSSLPGESLTELADQFLDAIKSGAFSNGKSLELFPKILSSVAIRETIPMGTDGGGEMAGSEYRSHLLNSICSSKWDSQCVIHLAAMFRDIPLSADELRFVIDKILRMFKSLELQELPPLVYQLLLLSTKGHKYAVLEGVTSFFSQLDESCKEQNKDSSEFQSFPVDQLRHMEGTIILHVTFAVKQDQDLGKEFLKYLKANQQCAASKALTPFNVALALSIAQIHRFEEAVFDFLKSSILKNFKDEERRKYSKWIKETIQEFKPVGDMVLETVQNSLFGWDHVTQGLVQLGFTLMDSFGPKGFDTVTTPHKTPAQLACHLGSQILLNTFKAHEMVRVEIIQQILNRVVTKATTPVTQYIELLSKSVASAPHVLLESLPRVKEALDYLSFLPPSTAEGLVKAIQPLMKISASLRDSLLLILRKAMFSRQVDARKIAVAGFLQILRNFKVLGGGVSASQPSSQSFSQSSQLQALVDVHIRGGSGGNEALCLEILGNLRRCLTQQGDVRLLLYEGLYEVLCRNPQLRQPILDALYTQFQKYYEQKEDVTPPIKLEPCLMASGDQVFLAEPMAHLLCSLMHCTVKCAEETKNDEDSEDSIEHTLNEVEDMLQSLVRRMIKSEMEDFELDKSADFSLNNSVGIKNNIFARLVLGVYELLIEYSYTEGELSAQSCEEILQLFGNYHKLSEVLREKANVPGKRGRSSQNEKQSSRSLMSLGCVASVLKALLSDSLPSHQQSLASLRGSTDFVKYALNVAVQKLTQIRESGSCDGASGNNKDHVYKQCCVMSRVFLKQIIGESSLNREQEKRGKGKKVTGLCLEGFVVAVNVVCCRYPDKLSQFLASIDTNRESNAGMSDNSDTQEQIYAHIKRFQRLLSSIISSDEDVTLKDFQSVINVISLLASHLDVEGQQFAHVHAWVQRICTDQNLDDISLTKVVVPLLFSLTFQCKTSANLVERTVTVHIVLSNVLVEMFSLLREMAQDVHSQLGDIDEDMEVEDRTHFAIVNPRTAAPTIALLLAAQTERVLDEIDWMVTKLKGELLATSSAAAVSDTKCPDSPDSTQRNSLEAAICTRLVSLVMACHELSQSAIPEGSCTEAFVKVLTKLYVTLGSLAKHYISLYTQKRGHMAAKFEKLVKLTGTHLSQQVYGLITYIQVTQSQSLQEHNNAGKGKGKDKKKQAAKGQNLTGKAKVMKEMRSIPNLIYNMEQYEKFLIQLSKKTKINLMEHFKRSTARDFRINGATLEAALREESSEEEEDDEDNSDHEDEPPRKKGKVAETEKPNKLGLKKNRGASKTVLAQANS